MCCPARLAQALSLADHLRLANDRSEYRDRAEFTRRLACSLRVTQVLNLMLLAPDIEERILDLEAVDGIEFLSGRPFRNLVRPEGRAGADGCLGDPCGSTPIPACTYPKAWYLHGGIFRSAHDV